MTPEINTFEVVFVPKRQAWRLLAMLGAAFILWFALSLLLPHDRYIRYQQLTDSDLFWTRWVYERIHYDTTPIDVAIIGSSRVEAGISAPVLEHELTEKLGRPIHVANLAIPQEGRNLHYLIARELMENHPETRIILVSAVEQDDISHPAFRYLADVRDLLQAPVIINHFYFLDAAFLPYRQMSYFIQTRIPNWFGVSRTLRPDYMGTSMDTTHSFYLPSGKLVDRNAVASPEKLALSSAQLIQQYGGTWKQPTRWQALNFPIEPKYTRKLVDAAKEDCVEVIFVRFPFYDSPPNIYDEGFYRSLGPLLDAEQLAKDPQSYSDVGHFNRRGIDQVSPWLWISLAPYLHPLDSQETCIR